MTLAPLNDMKFSYHSAILYLLFTTAMASSSSKNDLICNESGDNCYPKEFEATKEWQIVKPGQTIPAGLHVRLNLETGLQEAKLLDESDSNDSKAIEVVVPESEELIPIIDDNDDLIADSIEDTEQIDDEKEFKHTVKQAGSSSAAGDLEPSLEVVKASSSRSSDELSRALETLADLGHELDFGSIIAQPSNFEPLVAIALDSNLSPSVREISLRAIGASLRNNPDALKLVRESQITKQLLMGLSQILSSFSASSLASDTSNNRLAGRFVYALGSVVGTDQGSADLYSKANADYTNSNGGSVLRKLFEQGGGDVKLKVAQFVTDRVMGWTREEARAWSFVFQTELANNSVTDDVRGVLFSTLVKMHEYTLDETAHNGKDSQQQVLRKRDNRNQDEELPVEDNFLNWLAEQTTKKGSDEFVKEAIRVRHEVFGNPLARRKAFIDDEL